MSVRKIKPCTDCGRTLPRSAFHANGPGRVAGRCKECTNRRKRAAYAANPQPRDRANAAWKSRNPERVEAARQVAALLPHDQIFPGKRPGRLL